MEQQKVKIWQEDMIIPTYELGEDERLPIFYKLRVNQGTKGDIYPYKNRDTLLMKKMRPTCTKRSGWKTTI